MERISDFTLFRFLSEKEMEEVLNKAALATFNAGEIIIKKSSLNQQAGLLIDGYAKLYAERESYRRIIEIVKPGWMMALLSVFNEKVYDVSVSAITSCEVVFVSKQLIEKLIRNNGLFAERFIKTQSLIANRYIHFLAFQNQKNVRGRIAEVLIYLSEHIYGSSGFVQTFSRREMADFANTTTETVIRIIAEFRRDGIIDNTDKNISILNMELLKKIGEKG